MNRIGLVFLYELKRNARRKGYLFATFGIPLLIFVLMMGYNLIQQVTTDSQEEPDITEMFDFEGINVAGYVDLSGEFTIVPESLTEMLIRYDDVETARAAMEDGTVDVFYILADDYRETGDVTLHLPGFALSLMTEAPMQQLVYQTFAPSADQNILARLSRGSNLQVYNLSDTGNDESRNEDADMVMLYLFSITFALGIMLTNSYLLQTIIEEKESDLIEILISTLRPMQLLAGKTLAMSLLGIVQIVVWLLSMVLLLRIGLELSAFADMELLQNLNLPLNQLPIMLVYFVLGYLLFATLFGIVGALSSSMKEGPQYAVIFTLPAFAPYYFATVFTTQPNSTLPTVLSMIPITSPISMMMRISVTTVPLVEIAISIVLLVLSLVFAIWLAGRLFRVQTLLAGQTPKLKELPGLLLGNYEGRKQKPA